LCQRFDAVDDRTVTPTGYYYLLSVFASHSKTTEMPDGMLEIIAKHPALSEELRIWYRLPL